VRTSAIGHENPRPRFGSDVRFAATTVPSWAATRTSADTRPFATEPARAAHAADAALSTSWMSPKLVPADITIAGRGTYALVEIAAGEVVVAFGVSMVAGDVFAALPARRRALSIQVADDLYCVGPERPEPNDMVNHSCDPNCGILGSTILVAIRPIAAGEELCYDYAMSDRSAYDEFALLLRHRTVSRSHRRERLVEA
jgi:hypothetical protein